MLLTISAICGILWRFGFVLLVLMSETVIKVENISKFYQLGLINHGTLAKDLQGWWAKIRGKEDPNSRVSLVSNKSTNSDTDFIYALKDVSFDVKQGEVLGIIGANGAGKSTLLKILSRVTSPTSGCIKIKGRIGSLLEVGTGFHPELTGRENIYLNGAILGMRKHEIDRKLDEIIDFSGVEKFIDTPVKRYSSGMYVRLAFAVAAHLDPEILVVDEVLAVGDADFQKKCLGKMDDVSKKEGRTVLFVSHNMKSIRQLCNNGALLKNGQLDYIGNINDVVDRYLSVYQSEGLCSYAGFESDKNKTHQIIEVKLTDDSGNILNRAINTTDVFFVHIKYRFSKHISNLHLAMGILNMDEEYIYFQDRSDYYKKYASVDSGIYESVIQIPNPLLNEGTYMISFGCTDIETGINNGARFALKFKIVDTSSLRKAKRAGYLLLPLQWELDKL